MHMLSSPTSGITDSPINLKLKDTGEPLGRVPSEAGDENAPNHEKEQLPKPDDKDYPDGLKSKSSVRSSAGSQRSRATNLNSTNGVYGDEKRVPSKGNGPFEKWERDEMEKLLGELRGHLVLYPTRFLEGEDVSNNFLFNADR